MACWSCRGYFMSHDWPESLNPTRPLLEEAPCVIAWLRGCCGRRAMLVYTTFSASQAETPV